MSILKLFAASALAFSLFGQEKSRPMIVYIGTYTGGESKGIYAFEFSPSDGSLKERGLVAETPSPSFLAIHPNKKFLYAVNEIGEFKGQNGGSVTAFSIDSDSGKLTKLNDQWSGGDSPCHIIVDDAGKNVLVANYGGGNVAVLPINPDGTLQPHSDLEQHSGSSIDRARQEAPHAHSIHLDSSQRFAVAVDLGVDKLLVYKYDAQSGKLAASDPAFCQTELGGGPRHLTWHPSRKLAYVNLEMTSKVAILEYQPEACAFKPLEVASTLPPNWEGKNSTAEILVHPNGKFLYVSNRGHDSIAIFSTDNGEGNLSLVGHESTQGKTPRNFNIDPTGAYLIAANQDSDSLIVFKIDSATGRLSPTGETVKVPKPVCVKFLAP